MDLRISFWRRLVVLVRRGRFARELEDEIRFHLEMKAGENVERGLPPGEALAAARRQLGNTTLVREQARDVWLIAWLEAAAQDLRYALRMLVRTPSFTAAVLVTLALGIAANTLIFSIVNTSLLHPVPYRQPDRLLMIQGEPWMQVAPFLRWRSATRVTDGVAAFDLLQTNLEASEHVERLSGVYATANYFPLLGVQPILGRTFRPEEEKPGNGRVVLLGEGLWQRRFGRDPDVVGRPVSLDGIVHTVIGVMGAGSQFFTDDDSLHTLGKTEIWVPLVASAEINLDDADGRRYVAPIARLKPGASVEAAQAELEALVERSRRDNPGSFPTDPRWRVTLRPLPEQVVRHFRLALVALAGAVGFVLCIACVNVASLLLARAATRRREIAIRRALGAGGLRLVRQLLTESVALGLVGGALGLALSCWGLDLVRALLPGDLPRAGEIAIDRTALAFTLLTSLLTSLLFGLAPALAACRPELVEVMKQGRWSAPGGPGRNRVLGGLVVMEVALSVVLLVGAGVMVRSFLRLERVDPGFNASQLLTATVTLPVRKYETDAAIGRFYADLLDGIRALPGVVSVGTVNQLPITRWGGTGVGAEGRDEVVGVNTDTVSPDYFSAMEIPLLRGRTFDGRDTAGAPEVAIINSTLARRFWPDGDPVGKRLVVRSNNRKLTIVGVVGDVKRQGLGAPTDPGVFVPYFQPRRSLSGRWSVVIRAASDPGGLSPALRQVIRGLDSDVPAEIRTMGQIVADSIAPARFRMLLLTSFSALALVMAAAGIYGVMSYAVACRTHEIGVRMALGAGAGDVRRTVLRRALALATSGLALGAAGALAATRVLSKLLFEVSPADPATFAAVSILLGGAALAASYGPARRAARIDPMEALRHE
jgi:predicted permease